MRIVGISQHLKIWSSSLHLIESKWTAINIEIYLCF